MALEPYLKRELVLAPAPGVVATRDALFTMLAQAVHSLVPTLDAEALRQQLAQREQQMPTSTPEGIAFPHAIAPNIDQTVVAAAKIAGGVDFGTPGHPRSDLIFCMFGCTRDPWEHVRLLARLARIVHTAAARDKLRAAADAEHLYQTLVELDRSYE